MLSYASTLCTLSPPQPLSFQTQPYLTSIFPREPRHSPRASHPSRPSLLWVLCVCPKRGAVVVASSNRTRRPRASCLGPISGERGGGLGGCICFQEINSTCPMTTRPQLLLAHFVNRREAHMKMCDVHSHPPPPTFSPSYPPPHPPPPPPFLSKYLACSFLRLPACGPAQLHCYCCWCRVLCRPIYFS